MVEWNRKRWRFGAACCAITAVLAFGLAIFIPGVVRNQVNSTIADQIILKSSTEENWASVPGANKVPMERNVYVFNLTNPVEVLAGAPPDVREVGPFVYTENRDMIDLKYSADTDLVSYRLYDRFTLNLKKSVSDPAHTTFTNLNLGPFNVFFQGARQSRAKIAALALHQIVDSMLTDFYYGVLGTAMMQASMLTNGREAWDGTVEGLGDPFDKDTLRVEMFWNDEKYGFNDKTGANWVLWGQAIAESDSVPNPPGAYDILVDHFGSRDWIDKLLKTPDNFVANSAMNAQSVLKNVFACPLAQCSPEFLMALQWGTSQVTMYHDDGCESCLPGFLSIQNINNTLIAYPEFAAFSILVDKTNVSIDSDRSAFLLSSDGLVSAPRIEQFWSLFNAEQYGQIYDQFKLNKLEAQVMNRYLNYLVDMVALQNTTQDTLVGTKFGSTVMWGTYSDMRDNLTLYIYAKALHSAPAHFGPVDMLNEINTLNPGLSDSTLDTILNHPKYGWTTLEGKFWWYDCMVRGLTSLNCRNLIINMKITEKVDSLIQVQSADTSSFVRIRKDVDQKLAQKFNCALKTDVNSRCRFDEIAAIQWATNQVTLEPIDGYDLTPVASYQTFWPYNTLDSAPEFGGWQKSVGRSAIDMTYDSAMYLLDFLRLLCPFAQQLLVKAVDQKDEPTLSANWKMTLVQGEEMVRYLGYLVDSFAFKGLWQQRTVHEVLFGYEDSFVKQVKTTNKWAGGDPSVDPVIQVADNMTSVEKVREDHPYHHSVIAGAKDMSYSRQFNAWEGVDYISYFKTEFDGINVVRNRKEPWKTRVPIKGSDGQCFGAYLDKNKKLDLFVDAILHPGRLVYSQDTDTKGVSTWRYTLDPDLMANATTNPDNDVFYMYGPNGMANLTAVKGGPIFATKPHFLDVSPVPAVTGLHPDRVSHDTWVDIEPNTGMTMNVQQQLMISFQLNPNMVYPSVPTDTYLPLFYMKIVSSVPQDKADEAASGFDTANKVTVWGQVLGYLGGSLAVIATVYILYNIFRANKKPATNQNQHLQPLLYQSHDDVMPVKLTVAPGQF
eukprot:GILJ01001246.1.p1 GENE.GILJ01001246.1~~GILJ01001246.1.p1  ORF type:complete len:1070 (-),score=190.07 GILJ01001246.1:120-3290(-)